MKRNSGQHRGLTTTSAMSTAAAAMSSTTSTTSTTPAIKVTKLSKYELSSKYATSEEDAKLRNDFSLLRRMIRGALRHGTAPNPDEEELPNTMVLDLCRKHPEWALLQYETEREGIQLSPLKFLIHNRARFPVLKGFCESFPQAAQEHDLSTSSSTSTSTSTSTSMRLFLLDGYPLHLACVTRQEEGAFIALLAKQYPQAVSATNDSGMLPLHLLLEYRGLSPSLEGVQALVELYPQAMLQKPPQSSNALLPPIITVLTAHHCSNEIRDCIWKHAPKHLTCLQLDANILTEVTLPIAKAICHVLPQLTHLQWTPQRWAPNAFIYFAQKFKRLNDTLQLQKLILKPPPPPGPPTPPQPQRPFHWPTTQNQNNRTTNTNTTTSALTPTHTHRAFVNLLQHVGNLEYLDIQGVIVPPAAATGGFGFGFAAARNNQNNPNNNPFLQQQQQQQPRAFGFGFQNSNRAQQQPPQQQPPNNNQNPTWQLLANNQQGRNNNNAAAAPANNANANNRNNSSTPRTTTTPTIPDISEPIVQLITNGQKLKYLKVSGYALQFQPILKALTANSTLEQLILNDTIADTPPPPPPSTQILPAQVNKPLTLGYVLEHANVTLQKAEVRFVVPRQPSPERQAILLEYNQVKFYTLLNQYGRAVARDQTTSLQTILGLLLRAQRELLQQSSSAQQQPQIGNHQKHLVTLGILFGLLRESPGSWSQPNHQRRQSININNKNSSMMTMMEQQQQDNNNTAVSHKPLFAVTEQEHASVAGLLRQPSAADTTSTLLLQLKQNRQQTTQVLLQQQANRKRKDPPFALFNGANAGRGGKELRLTTNKDETDDDDNE